MSDIWFVVYGWGVALTWMFFGWNEAADEKYRDEPRFGAIFVAGLIWPFFWPVLMGGSLRSWWRR